MKIERHLSSTESVAEIARVIYEDELDWVTGTGGGYNGIVMDDTAGKEGIRKKVTLSLPRS